MALKHATVKVAGQKLAAVADWNANHTADAVVIPNLNADLLDGKHEAAFQPAGSYMLKTGDTATGNYIFNSVNGNPTLKIKADNSGRLLRFYANDFVDSSAGSSVYFTLPNSSAPLTIQTYATGETSYSHLALNPNGTGTTGCVGIGTLAPDARFEIDTGTTEGKQAMSIQQDDADKAFIDYQGTSSADANNNISTWTVGTIKGFIKIEINGTEGWMPIYNAPTS